MGLTSKVSMAHRKIIEVPLNRVEGDLEIRVLLDDGVVVDSWSSGTMYRGFERIMVGREALDGLVITPRICGICSTAHLMAACLALDEIAGVSPPPDAVRIRNLTLMAELLQSDVRQSFLMFTADFCNPGYAASDLYSEALGRYEPLKGRAVRQVIDETKRILEIVAIFGGQWPHSSYMVPGGITSVPGTSDLLQCHQILARYRRWYERRIMGCSLERWQEVSSETDLDEWLHENDAHYQSELGFFLRFARKAGLDKIGRSHDQFLSYGSLALPQGTAVKSAYGTTHLIPAGFARGSEVERFHQSKVSEHVAYSWFQDYGRGRHPYEGETRPYATGREGKKYSWAKAPRYGDLPAETGPLAELVMSRHSLFQDLVAKTGSNALVRQLARIVRPAFLIPVMEKWLKEISRNGRCYTLVPGPFEGQGCGLIHGARGALGHWVKIADNKVTHYQIVTPTAWNGSPRDSDGVRGPWEEALIGTPVRDLDDPVELGHVIRSFDACQVCTVHTIRGPGGAPKTAGRLGIVTV